MNVPPSSVAPAAATGGSSASARSDAAEGAEPGAFAELLDQRLQRASQGGQHGMAVATPPARPGARKPHEAPPGEAQEAGALPLIAAAIEGRSLAHPRTQAPTGTRDRAASPLPAHPVPADRPDALRPADTPGTPELAPAALAQAGAAPLHAAPAGHDAAQPRMAPARFGETGHPETDAGAPPALAAAQALSSGPAPAALATRPASQPASPLKEGARDRSLHATQGSDNAAMPALRGDAAPAHETVHASSDEAASIRTDPALPAPIGTGATTSAPTAAAFPSSAPAQGYVAPPVASAAWGPALGQELARLHHAGHGEAQLELNPPGLGPLSVSLSVTDQQAHAVFVSPHPEVRAAVDAALPELRSALAENGISLGQASVGAEHQPHSGAFMQSGQEQARQRRPVETFAAPQRTATSPLAPLRVRGHGLDTFA